MAYMQVFLKLNPWLVKLSHSVPVQILYMYLTLELHLFKEVFPQPLLLEGIFIPTISPALGNTHSFFLK